MFLSEWTLLTACLCAGMRGSTPLDVAAASCIDNNELALALQEQDLEMVRGHRNKAEGGQWSCLLTVSPVGHAGGDVLGGLRAADVPHAFV